MNKKMIEELAVDLRRKKSSLLQDLMESHMHMQTITDERESELEESAQKDLITRLTSRLKDRDQKTIRDIEAALERMAAGDYGLCENCGDEIGIGRLRALPMAELCIDCATTREKRQQAGIIEEPPESSERLSVRVGEELD
jgi:RNA polymerase-binding transcription factor